ncbi:MAG TPA: stage II sporulation protein M [Burkholderiales bacterium]|jgi:uncharacterized membrane protein SpoIIM required for sporulation|nr:stage II sporulation protein M [Burkholderiales bacterium]
MKQALFEERYGPQWTRFEQWLDRREKLRGRQGEAADALQDAEVPAAYRRLCQWLALARERRYSPDLVEHLNRLALRGHHVLYGARGGQSARLWMFLAAGFPRLVRAQWRVILAAAVLFMGSLALLFGVVLSKPDFIIYLVEPEHISAFQEMYDPKNQRLGMREGEDNVMMFAFYIWNNVKIGFQVFATGVLFGMGTVFFLLYNGALIGAVAAYLTGIGYGEPFWSFVSGHSALELTAIVIAGAAGLKLGGAVIAPGLRSRRTALVEAARPAARLVYGAALMFVMAAFVEGFWSPLTTFSPSTKYLVGAALWALVLAYFSLAGRARAT